MLGIHLRACIDGPLSVGAKIRKQPNYVGKIHDIAAGKLTAGLSLPLGPDRLISFPKLAPSFSYSFVRTSFFSFSLRSLSLSLSLLSLFYRARVFICSGFF